MRGPCQILKESWLEDQILPLKMGSDSCQYLADLKADLESAQSYAQCHPEKAHNAYVERYNRRSCDKSFQVGESVLILAPDSTISKVFSRWQGPAQVVEVLSPYSYLVELDGKQYRLHANKLRKFHYRVEAVLVPWPCENLQANTCAVIYERDSEFGEVSVIEPKVKGNLPSN